MIIKSKKEISLHKTLKILPSFLILLLFICPSYSQKLFEKVYDEVKSIEKITKDPIIIIGPAKTFYLSKIGLKNNSNVNAWEWYYVLFKEGNKNKIIKYVETLEDFEGKKIFQSQIIQFKNDTLFEWLSSQEDKVKSEEILPFIYVDTTLNVPYYKQGFLMHSFPFNVSVNFYADRKLIHNSAFEFDEVAMKPALMPEVMELPKNLNFEYNRRLQIFQLYTILTKILSNYTDQFKFF